MSPHQVIAVGVRLFAVWLGISVFRAVPSLYFGRYGFEAHPLVATVTLLVASAVVVFLWLLPQTIARRLLPSSNSEALPSASPDLWLAMGCALIGLWVVSSTLPSLIQDALILLAWSGGSDDISSVKHQLVYNAVEVAVGIWLVLGGKGFRKVFWWARNAGY
jgi:hypothetical protein